MGVEDVAKHPSLFLREEKDGTRRYYLGARGPLDLVDVIGKREIKKSQRTATRMMPGGFRPRSGLGSWEFVD